MQYKYCKIFLADPQESVEVFICWRLSGECSYYLFWCLFGCLNRIIKQTKLWLVQKVFILLSAGGWGFGIQQKINSCVSLPLNFVSFEFISLPLDKNLRHTENWRWQRQGLIDIAWFIQTFNPYSFKSLPFKSYKNFAWLINTTIYLNDSCLGLLSSHLSFQMSRQ